MKIYIRDSENLCDMTAYGTYDKNQHNQINKYI